MQARLQQHRRSRKGLLVLLQPKKMALPDLVTQRSHGNFEACAGGGGGSGSNAPAQARWKATSALSHPFLYCKCPGLGHNFRPCLHGLFPLAIGSFPPVVEVGTSKRTVRERR